MAINVHVLLNSELCTSSFPSGDEGDFLARNRTSDSLKISRIRVGAAGRTTAFYLVFGLIWILVSGMLFDRLFVDPERLVLFEWIKGSLFVVTSALLIYFLIARHAERVLQSEIESIEHFKQSEQRFRTLVDGISDHLIVLLNGSGEIVTWNPGAEILTGFSQDDVRGKHFRILFTAEDRENGLPEKILEDAKSGAISTSGLRLRADGSSFSVDGTISPVRNREGEIVGFTQIAKDLTDVVAYQHRLNKRIAQQSIIAESGRLAITTRKISSLYSSIAEQTARGLGADASVLLCVSDDPEQKEVTSSWRTEGSEPIDEFPADDIMALAAAHEELEVASSPSLGAFPALTKLGYRSAAAVRFASSAPESRHLAVMFRESEELDEDDRHFLAAMARIAQNSLMRGQAQHDVTESESKLSLIIDQIPAIVWTVDTDLVIRSSAGSGLRLLGLSPNRSVGLRAADRIPPAAVEVVAKALEGSPVPITRR